MVETKEDINLKLSGMTCANCALKIENKLNNLEGVKNAVVNFANEEATVEYNPKSTNYETFNKAIKDLGYRASLAKIDIKVVESLSKDDFENLVGQIKIINGIYSVRGNYNALKLFIEFNEFQIGENQVYSKIKKLGYNIELTAGAMDKEIEQHKKEMKYRLRILITSLIFMLII